MTELLQAFLDFGRIGEHPTVDRAVVDLEAAFEKHAFEIAETQGIAQIPGDGLNDEPRLEVSSPEIVFGPALQLSGKGGQNRLGFPVVSQAEPLRSTHG
jgi:hypothetical protein